MAGIADDADAEEDEAPADPNFSNERYVEMSAAENLILTISSQGSGKLSSSHDYPVRGRGGMGVTAMDKAMRGGEIVASFPVEMDAKRNAPMETCARHQVSERRMNPIL